MSEWEGVLMGRAGRDKGEDEEEDEDEGLGKVGGSE